MKTLGRESAVQTLYVSSKWTQFVNYLKVTVNDQVNLSSLLRS